MKWYTPQQLEQNHRDLVYFIANDVFSERNKLIKEQASALATQGVAMTPQALEKSYDYVSTLGDMLEKTGHPSKELSFYLQSDDAKTVTDVTVHHDQQIYNAYVDTPAVGCIKSTLRIRNGQHPTIMGWMHSHGEYENEFSPQDRGTFDNVMQDYGVPKKIHIAQHGNNHEYNSTITYGVVINNQKDTPFTCVGVSVPQYHVQKDGTVTMHKKRLRFDDVPLHTACNSTPETYEPHDDLVERVHIGETPLKEIVPEKEQSTIENIVDDQSTLEPIPKQPSSLDDICHSWTDALVNKKRYADSMTTYADALYQSSDHSHQTAAVITDILSGTYRADINDIRAGQYDKKDDKPRLWTWEKRLEAIQTILENDTTAQGIDNVIKTQIMTLLHKNTYLKRKHKGKLQRLQQLLVPTYRNVA